MMDAANAYLDPLDEIADRPFGSVLQDRLVSFDLSDVKFEEDCS